MAAKRARVAGAAGAEGDADADAQPEEEPRVGPRPLKSYGSTEFLNSHDARLVRIICELQEPAQRLRTHGIENIVMFFGSARIKGPVEHERAVREQQARCDAAPEDEEQQAALRRLRKQASLAPLCEVVTELARRLTVWSQQRAAEGSPAYVVGTGAGPGLMEAANKGAWRAGGPSVGFGISLPHEPRLNPFIRPELGFEFHYFFTRKFWMSYKCMGLVVAPGGLGTCDELFELMTLMQTRKIRRPLPVILIGRAFWQSCVNFAALVEYGVIDEADAAQLAVVDTADEAFEALTSGIRRVEDISYRLSPKKKAEPDRIYGGD